MATTAKGYRYPIGTDPNNTPLDIQRLAEDVDASPGIRAYTQAQIDALPADQKWTGRKVWNVTAGVHQNWNGAQWVSEGALTKAEADATYQALSGKGVANGYGSLGADARQPASEAAAWQGQTARVVTSETTISTAFTDLATAGPAVTVTPPASGRVRVTLSGQVENSNSLASARMGVALSGGNTVAASFERMLAHSGSGGTPMQGSRSFVLTGLAAGSTTFTTKYAVSGGTGTFYSREITVEPLP